jgi:tetratricopeptide (TPR) repeat protein
MSDTQSGPPPKLFIDIDAAMRRGDIATAITMARHGLEQSYNDPVLFSLRAYWHETEGRLDAACADLQRALALAPGDSRTLNALGRCRTANGQFGQALAALDAALAAEPVRAIAHYNKAFAHEQLGELDQAWESYSRARQFDPTMVDAIARLASLASRRGNEKEARALADTALAIQPGHPIAIFAHVVCDLTEGRFADAERRASSVAEDDGVVEQARINALSFVADALDGQGRWPEAFAQYTAANDGLKTLFRDRFEGAGRETGRKLAERLAREFATYPAQTSPEISTPLPGDAAGIVFLLGFPRSGTTLLGQILAAHSNVVTIEEKPLLGDGIGTYIQQPGGLVRLATLGPEEIERHRAAFFERVRDHGVQTKGRVVIDQTPLNTLHLPLIAKLFPEARIVFAVRDPRDVVLSCFRRLFVVNTYVYEFLSLTGGTHFYDETMKLVGSFRSALPLAWHDIRNEDLIADFDGEVRRLCAFLGLAYEDSMRDFARASQVRRIATPSAMQVIRGIKGDGVGHWRNYEAELAPVLPVLASWVERFGYE